MSKSIFFNSLRNLFLVEDLATKWTTKDISVFQNILWIYHFYNGSDDVYNKIWKTYLQSASTLRFGALIYKIRSDQNEQLAIKLIEFMKTSNSSDRYLGIAHSNLMEIYCDKEQYDQALEALNTVVMEVFPENMNIDTLTRLKICLQSIGKAFPYTIPRRFKWYVKTGQTNY